MSEPCHLKRVYHAVVSVRAFAHLEARSAVRLELVLRVLYDSGEVTG